MDGVLVRGAHERDEQVHHQDEHRCDVGNVKEKEEG